MCRIIQRSNSAALPEIAMADKVLGKAQKIGILDQETQSPLKLENEEQLGSLLLAIVQAAKAQGLDSERSLRQAVGDLSSDIRKAEVLRASDAGVIGQDPSLE